MKTFMIKNLTFDNFNLWGGKKKEIKIWKVRRAFVFNLTIVIVKQQNFKLMENIWEILLQILSCNSGSRLWLGHWSKPGIANIYIFFYLKDI